MLTTQSDDLLREQKLSQCVYYEHISLGAFNLIHQATLNHFTLILYIKTQKAKDKSCMSKIEEIQWMYLTHCNDP